MKETPKLTIEAKCPACGKTHIRTPFSDDLSEDAKNFIRNSLCYDCRTRRGMLLSAKIHSRLG